MKKKVDEEVARRTALLLIQFDCFIETQKAKDSKDIETTHSVLKMPRGIAEVSVSSVMYTFRATVASPFCVAWLAL